MTTQLKCRKCRPEDFPPGGPPQKEGHVSVHRDHDARYSRVYLNGEDITNICDEAIPGDGDSGLAVVFVLTPAGDYIDCPCNHPWTKAQTVVQGQVTVTTEYPWEQRP